MACECELQNTLDVEVTQDALLDVEIGGSAGVLLQAKSVDVEYNGTIVVSPDDGFDGLSGVEINTNVPKRFECGDAYFSPPAKGATSISIVGLLKTLNASCWDTSKVTNMGYMFNGFSYLQQLDVSGWNTSRVTNMNGMLRGFNYMKSIDVSGFDTSSVISMESMFRDNLSLQSVDVSKWNASNVDNANNIFNNCRSLCTIIGNNTLQDVENGIVALRGTKVNIQTNYSPLRFSSILALANGLADLTGQIAQTLTISAKSYNNMYNDDDTIPTADMIAERRARIAAICAAKNWNFAH